MALRTSRLPRMQRAHRINIQAYIFTSNNINTNKYYKYIKKKNCS